MRVTYAVDGAMAMLPSAFFPGFPMDCWDAHPEVLDEEGRLAMSAGGLLVERDGRRLLIDAGMGPGPAGPDPTRAGETPRRCRVADGCHRAQSLDCTRPAPVPARRPGILAHVAVGVASGGRLWSAPRTT
ncbi:hypothetical protein [Streptomyces sp. NPDC048411]|uniref:hypothetical protein n=1 Tax=Streptomyces sp. NPDC048411 TaxID=3157206 RepID=UPI00345542D1